jgi:MFS family permease
MTRCAVLVHQVVYLMDAGSTRMAAASYFPLGTLVAVPAGLAAGAVLDRAGRPRAYAGIAGLYAVAYLALLFVRGPSGIVPLAAFILACGMATGGGPPVFAALLTDRLQGPHSGYLRGLQNIGFGIGAMLGPLLAGALFDGPGGYAVAFVPMVGGIVVSSAIVSAPTPGGPNPSR